RVATPLRARPRGRVRRHHRPHRDDQDPQRGGATPGAAAVGMNVETPLPADTADARSARRASKAARKHERAQERAEARRARRAAPLPSGGGPGEAVMAQGDAAAQEQGKSLTRLWDSAVVLLIRRLQPVLNVVLPVGWVV